MPGDYEIRLPNGYLLARVYSKPIIVVAPNRRVVMGPTVERYAVKGDIVVGSVAQNGKRFWFVLNTKAHRLRMVGYQEWRSELRVLSVEESDVGPPSRLHALMQR